MTSHTHDPNPCALQFDSLRMRSCRGLHTIILLTLIMNSYFWKEYVSNEMNRLAFHPLLILYEETAEMQQRQRKLRF